MEPASAFALAGGIIQFIDCSSRFLSLVYRLYRNKLGKGHWSELEQPTQRLIEVFESFNLSGNDADQTEAQQSGLAELASECREIAQELMRHLEVVNFRTHLRKGDVLLRALQVHRMGDTIKTLQLRLENCRDQFSFHLLASLRFVHFDGFGHEQETSLTVALQTICCPELS